jgi:hypothetical protein
MRIRFQNRGITPVGYASFERGPQAENCFCFLLLDGALETSR